MANFLNIENLTKSYGDRLLFGDITFGVDEGDKIGIVARNGTGKSTLLSIIAGTESADSGTVVFRKGIRVAYLPQDPVFAEGATVISAALDNDDPVAAVVRRYSEALALGDAGRTQELTHEMDTAGAWDYEDRLRRLLTRLGLEDMSAPVSRLSGGQRKRLAIARTVMCEPDFLILDEPTNHLDISTIEWLENFLKRSRATLLMVTHDRYFLDRVCNRIIEMDNCSVFTVDGNYDKYLARRAERIEAMAAEHARVRNTLRREQEWMSRQPQARAGKAKFRIDNFYDLRERARSTVYRENNVKLDAVSSRVGSKIFEAENICKRFGDKVILDGFSYIFAPGEKLGIVGENGVGKSTFIKMLQGLLPADSGEWNVGETVRFGYYSQEGIALDTTKKVADAVTELAEDIDLGEGRRIAPMQYLQRFLFSPADQQKYIYTLSGGERCRLHLATVLMRQPNFLILDEPTNDLDIITLGILEEYLSEFKGCVIVVSHDRYFLDNIVDHLFVMEGNGVVRDFPGNYSDYRAYLDSVGQQQTAETRREQAAGETRRSTAERPARMSFKERKEFEALEAELEALNAEKAALEEFFASGETTDSDDFNRRSQRYAALGDIIDEKELRWLELSEKA
ncbi:ABC-F family ATP-binding cassette domain-containing protein [Duncaniella dubosii]|uniref:ABC-F family ATP-binding cassette domain-containing protein n=1 Tax=Duncaniella dubosii TaxID=2518971 RepID=UPI0023F21F11|nr:ABC-F family ATP-binding cassette domain-containing protein [Duncaniella dubosii]MCX4284859.1 ABC-F family ATP-binding cassette domain-containing protein [Duncaniella dubosii]